MIPPDCLNHLLAPITLLLLVAITTIACQQNNATNNRNPLQHLTNYFGQEPVETSSVYQENGLDSADLSSSMLKTFIRANEMRAYHLDLHQYRSEAKFVGDPQFIDSENLEHQSRCSKHLNAFNQLLKSFNELDPMLAKNSLESIQLADIFGRVESGILEGNQFWLGSYEGCQSFKHKNHELEVVKGQYCLGVLQFPNWNSQDSKTSIKVGMCLPETCTSSMLNEDDERFKMTETMVKYNLEASKPFRKLKLREVYCLPHETSQIRQYSTSALAFLIVIGTFISISLFATIADHLSSRQDEGTKGGERNWRVIILESFSLKRNLEKLLYLREIKPDLVEQLDDSFRKETFLSSITGLKCIGLIWIICAHCFLVGPITSRNLLGLDKLTKTYLANIYLSAHLMVDTFFVISGILASYFLFKDGIAGVKAKNWIIMTIHRYWRLTPIYLLCYWFTKSIGILANSGPLWDYMTSEQSPRLNCARESWFEAILHLSDFKSPKDHCVPFAWFIANGIKFWMITPFILILIHKSVRRGYLTTLGLIIANTALVFVLAFRSDVDMKSIVEFRPESANNMLNNLGQVYTRPYSRIGTYLIGLIAGHFFYMLETNQLQLKLSKNSKIIIWTLFSVTMILLMFTVKIAGSLQMDDADIPLVFSLCSALVRPLWALCTCWLIYAMSVGQVAPIARFLSGKTWALLVKMSFCAYLVQGEVIANLYLSSTYSGVYTYSDMISRAIVTVVITLIVSSLMVIFLEYPLIGIEEIVLPRRNKISAVKNGEEVANISQVVKQKSS